MAGTDPDGLLATSTDRSCDRQVVWTPSERLLRCSQMAKFLSWINQEQSLDLVGYDELWRWSVEDLDEFWRSVWTWFAVTRAQPASGHPDRALPRSGWFPEARLNYAERMLRDGGRPGPAVIAISRFEPDATPRATEVSWSDLARQVASLADALRRMGVRRGDRVAVCLPSIPQAVVALLATAAVGAIWTASSPDLGRRAALDRFRQVGPVVLITSDGNRGHRRKHDPVDPAVDLWASLPTVRRAVLVRQREPSRPLPAGLLDFDQLAATDVEPRFDPLPFDHPLWILHRPAASGLPECLVHTHGGILLEHLKLHGLHLDTGPGDRVLSSATPAEMGWNTLVTALGTGATIVTYDSRPTVPTPDGVFRLCAEHRVTRLDIDADLLAACERAGIRPGERFGFPQLRSVITTGAPLPSSTQHWAYDKIKQDILVGSNVWCTGVCTSPVGTNPLLPVYARELQAPCLGVGAEVRADGGGRVLDQIGDLVTTTPMPSMPVSFSTSTRRLRLGRAFQASEHGVWQLGKRMVQTLHGGYRMPDRTGRW